MSKRTCAPNNNHLVKFRNDYPQFSTMQIASRFGVSENSISVWTTTKGFQRPAPFWTIEAVATWRKELEGNKFVDVTPVVQASDSGVFLVTVPAGKVASLKNIVGVLGGEITEM